MVHLAWLLLVLVARAGDCTALYETEARELIDASYAALEGEEPDLAEHDRLMRQLENRLPCADFEVSSELWARYLVSMAVRRYYAGGNWQSPLTTAKRVTGDTPMPVRQGHPLRAWEPAPRPSPRGPLPEQVTLRLDGQATRQFLPLDATHLLQRWNGDELQTAVVHGPADIPQAFLTPPRPPRAIRQARRRRAVHTWGTVGSVAAGVGGGILLGAGVSAHRQFTDPATPQSELGDLRSRGRTASSAGTALLSTGAAGLAATWVVKW